MLSWFVLISLLLHVLKNFRLNWSRRGIDASSWWRCIDLLWRKGSWDERQSFQFTGPFSFQSSHMVEIWVATESKIMDTSSWYWLVGLSLRGRGSSWSIWGNLEQSCVEKSKPRWCGHLMMFWRFFKYGQLGKDPEHSGRRGYRHRLHWL